MQAEEEILGEIQKGLLRWYDFIPFSSVLYIGNKKDSLAVELSEKKLELTCASLYETSTEEWQRKYENKFDYIVSIEDLEIQLQPQKILKGWKRLSKLNGRMLLGMNNRLGLRFFCGDRERYTGRSFDGVENYRRAYVKKEDIFQGRMYSQSELKKMLLQSGWEAYRFFSVISDLENPSLIYSEDYLPNEDLANRVFPIYNYPDSVFLEEETIYASLLENGMFHQMANAYLIECSLGGEFSDVCQVTSSMERGKEDALLTIIHKNGLVEKKGAYPEGLKRLESLIEHGNELRSQGLSVVDAKIENGVLKMPYIEAEVGQVYLKRLLLTDKERFLYELDHFRDLILQSSEIAKPDIGDGEGVTLRRGYLDMVPLNSFYIDGKFVFYDQEFCKKNYPANAIIARMLATFYTGNIEFQKIISMDELFERYGLNKKKARWQKMEWEFLSLLRKEKELSNYHARHSRNAEVVNSNRQRINYSTDEYYRLFVDIFRNADSRKLILFGSGNFTEKFLELYSNDYKVYAIIDNNKEKLGQKLKGITIKSPKILSQLQSGEYKVLICIKNFLSVMKQLDSMDVTEYSVYDSNMDYPKKRNPIILHHDTIRQDSTEKMYHTGYIAGVFDLFHVGHLNMFKRAKEQCKYLIVGVVSDDGVRKIKKKEPFIPFEERIEMVRSCRYVDEAVEIPFNFGGTRDVWRLYHFDCQFSGSDYIEHPDWLAEKEFLEKHGAEMVFFPYTEQTSSTKIKSLIEHKLL